MKRATCVDCSAPLFQLPGRGRGKLRCDECWERLNRGSHREYDRACLECGEPAAFNRSYCADHPTVVASGPARVCPCGAPPALPSWYCSPGCRAEARAEASRRRSRNPAVIAARKELDRRRTPAKNAEDKPHRKPEWKRVRLIVLADHPPCGICGDLIDYGLRFPDPMSPSVDHIVSWRKGGAWFDLANLRAAHFRCNAGRRDEAVA